MKAIVVHQFGGPEVMRIEDVPIPEPGAGQVLVKIAAVGVNPDELQGFESRHRGPRDVRSSRPHLVCRAASTFVVSHCGS